VSIVKCHRLILKDVLIITAHLVQLFTGNLFA
jgi:hypothetical protein